MTLNEYQEIAGLTDEITDEQASRGYYYAGLTGEAGEVADHYKKMIRDDNGHYTQQRKDAIIKELGDCLWYIARISFRLGVKLDDVGRINNEKLESRQARGMILGSGDER